jgi:glycosyltransferase involved in cell wall biosynthesis
VSAGKKTITGIFLEAENVHFVKDVGQIAYCMHKRYGYDATLVSYRNSPDYNYLNSEVKGLKHDILEDRGKIFFLKKAVWKYLFDNSRKIDVLYLIHFRPVNFIYFVFYKILNPEGLAYLKLDHDVNSFNGFMENSMKNPFTAAGAKFIIWLAGKVTDMFSIETKSGINIITEKHKEIGKKTVHIPSGIDDEWANRNAGGIKNFGEKENVILTVGRIGTKQKNTEMLLKAAAAMNLKEWKIEIVGPVEEEFKKYIDDYFIAYPQLKNVVTFRGAVSDRKELYSEYNRAKIFCLTSRYESFGIVLVEALYFGNYVVTTMIPPADDILENGTAGTVVPQENDLILSRTLQSIIDDENLLKRKYYDEIEQSKKFTWHAIAEMLDDAFTKSRASAKNKRH